MTLPVHGGVPATSVLSMPADEILYIVGNGFDLHHGIASSYQEFGLYLKAVDHETYRELERYFGIDDEFWWEFEARLADLDTDLLFDDAGQFLASYGAEDWSDAGHHDYQYELDRVVEAISKTLRGRFGDWVRQLAIPAPGSIAAKMLPLRRDARYLTFNYTDTLQRVYGVPEENVVHIHGAAVRMDEQLILGHGWERAPADSFNFGIDPEADTREIQGNEIVDSYFSETFKPTARVIQEHQPFFQQLGGIRKILVMGHSLSSVDLPYLHELRTHLGSTAVEWQVSVHQSSVSAERAMRALGVPVEHVQFVPLTEISRWACP